MIPTMARGLGSILFAINIDKEELNGIKQVSYASLSLPIITGSGVPEHRVPHLFRYINVFVLNLFVLNILVSCVLFQCSKT